MITDFTNFPFQEILDEAPEEMKNICLTAIKEAQNKGLLVPDFDSSMYLNAALIGAQLGVIKFFNACELINSKQKSK